MGFTGLPAPSGARSGQVCSGTRSRTPTKYRHRCPQLVQLNVTSAPRSLPTTKRSLVQLGHRAKGHGCSTTCGLVAVEVPHTGTPSSCRPPHEATVEGQNCAIKVGSGCQSVPITHLSIGSTSVVEPTTVGVGLARESPAGCGTTGTHGPGPMSRPLAGGGETGVGGGGVSGPPGG